MVAWLRDAWEDDHRGRMADVGRDIEGRSPPNAAALTAQFGGGISLQISFHLLAEIFSRADEKKFRAGFDLGA